jgi:CHAD domain-containing protein
MRARHASIRADLPPGTLRHLKTSLKKQAKRYRKKLKRCQEQFSEKAVHASRVEARRLLSIVQLLEPFLRGGRVEKVRQTLKQHLHSFNELRDTQVQLLAVGRMRRAFPAARPFYDYLLQREHQLAGETQKTIRSVKTARLRRLVAACRADVKKRLKHCDPRAASRPLLRSVHKAFARTAQRCARIDPRQTKTIHRTRVAFKKFRYMVEALAGHLPSVNKEVLARLRHYQTMMGDVQDAVVLLTALDKFLRQQQIASESAARLREELVRRCQWRIRVFLDSANQLREFWP